EPITPLPIEGGASSARPDDRICYKIKCEEPSTPIGDQAATDQFGSRTLTKLKASLVCTPAFEGSARFVDNGSSVTDNYTGLEWEKKNGADGVQDVTNPNDVDNLYCGAEPYAKFLFMLNTCTSADGSSTSFHGFAGHCDWRLPTIAELQTIVLPPPFFG